MSNKLSPTFKSINFIQTIILIKQTINNKTDNFSLTITEKNKCISGPI